MELYIALIVLFGGITIVLAVLVIRKWRALKPMPDEEEGHRPSSDLATRLNDELSKREAPDQQA